MGLSSLSIGYVVFYALCAIGIVFMPLICLRRSRRICIRRIRERRWNVNTDDLEEGSDHRPIYPPNDPRYNPTKEEAIEMKKKYMIEQLEGHSKVRYNSCHI